MSLLAKIAIAYATGGALVGALIASAGNVTASWKGNGVKHPRLVAGLWAAIVWPVVIWQMIFPPKNGAGTEPRNSSNVTKLTR